MARFRCAACSQEGEFVYDPDPEMHRCPLCGSRDVVFALPVDELPEEFIEALLHAEPLDDQNNEN
jgi:DNA-directed RNA polymerase subunit RPC12/RpoP